ncbi:hypothetical protein B0H11DRAFT_2074438, partial [Mycena galericulata]
MNRVIPLRVSPKRPVFSRRHYRDSSLPHPEWKSEPVNSKLPLPKLLPMSTFRPERLLPSDCVESFPNLLSRYYFRPEPQPALTSIDRQHVGAYINWVPSNPPEPCKGFLYYKSPAPPVTQLAGSLRFRLTPGFDPASGMSPQSAFAAGSDLLIPDGGGLPWALPTWSIAAERRLYSVRDILNEDGHLVPIPDPSWKPMTRDSLALCAIGQPFLVEFHMKTIRIWVLRPPLPAVCARIVTGFVDTTNRLRRSPYTGMGIMTLERLPNGSMVTRLQKIISLSQAYVNPLVAPLVEGMTRQLELAPVLFKERTKPTKPKYVNARKAVEHMVWNLPDISKSGTGFGL